MVNQNASPSDAPLVSENITNETVAGSGANAIPSVSDTVTSADSQSKGINKSVTGQVSITEQAEQQGQTLTIVLNPTFAHLNSLSYYVTYLVPTREKEIICDVTLPSGFAYAQGGVVLDFTKILQGSKLSKVYVCKVLNYGGYTLFSPDTNNDANEGHLKFYDHTGTELANGVTTLQNLKFSCYIRGN